MVCLGGLLGVGYSQHRYCNRSLPEVIQERYHHLLDAEALRRGYEMVGESNSALIEFGLECEGNMSQRRVVSVRC